MMRTLVLHSLRALAMNGAQIVFGLGTSVILARALGPEARGSYALVVLMAGTLAMLANPSIYASTNYHLSTGRWSLEEGFGTVMIASSFISGLVALIAALITPLIGLPVALGTDPIVRLSLAVLAGTQVFATSLNGMYFGTRRIGALTNWRISWSAAQCGLFLVLALIGITTQEFMLATAAMALLDIVVLTVVMCWGRSLQLRTSMAMLRALFGYGVPVYGARVLQYLGQRLDTYMVLWLAGTWVFGQYTIAVSLAEQLALLPVSVSMIMMPQLGRLEARESAEMTATAVRTSAALVIAGSLAFAAAVPIAIPLLYGAVYRDAVVPLLLLLPGTAAASVFMIAEPFFQSRGQPRIPLMITAIGVAVNALANLLLIPRFGMNGAAIAASCAYLTQLTLTCVCFVRATGLPIGRVLGVHLAAADMVRLVARKVALS